VCREDGFQDAEPSRSTEWRGARSGRCPKSGLLGTLFVMGQLFVRRREAFARAFGSAGFVRLGSSLDRQSFRIDVVSCCPAGNRRERRANTVC
jgi:hypothetical protein